MKFKIGDVILNRLGSDPDEKVDCEGIIVQHWQTKSAFRNGMADNIVIHMTFDRSFPSSCGKTDIMHNFRDDRWELKK